MKKLLVLMVLGVSLVFCSTMANAQMLQIKGSDTLINLVQRLSEVYMEKNPGKNISVTGGGSGTGIAAMINKTCDIANASRLMKDKEVLQANEVGVNPKRVIIAVDGLSVIVNEKNPVKQLTVEQIGKIFRGEITNWSEVGGEKMPISLYGRQSNSGTFVFFQEEILKADYSPSMKRMNGNSQIVEAVKQDLSGIGYVGIGYLKDAKGVVALSVAARPGSEYASPLDINNVKTGKYPISRPLNQYINVPVVEDVKNFIAFELSEEGQKIVEELGFYAIPKEYKDINATAGF